MELMTTLDRFHDLFLSQPKRDWKRIKKCGGYLPYAEQFAREKLTSEAIFSRMDCIYFLSGICVADDKSQGGYKHRYSPASIKWAALMTYHYGMTSKTLSIDNLPAITKIRKSKQPKKLTADKLNQEEYLYQSCNRLFSFSGFFLDRAEIRALEATDEYKHAATSSRRGPPMRGIDAAVAVIDHLTWFDIKHFYSSPTELIDAAEEKYPLIKFFRDKAQERASVLSNEFDRMIKEHPNTFFNQIYG